VLHPTGDRTQAGRLGGVAGAARPAAGGDAEQRRAGSGTTVPRRAPSSGKGRGPAQGDLPTRCVERKLASCRTSRGRQSLKRLGSPPNGGEPDDAAGGWSVRVDADAWSSPASRRLRLNSLIPCPIDDPISGIRLAPNTSTKTSRRMRM